MKELIKHKFLPRKINPDTEILIIGTFNPAIKENPAEFFYSREKNMLWDILGNIFCDTIKDKIKAVKEEFIKTHKIDFIDLIEESNIDEDEAKTYKDKYLDDKDNKWTNIIEEIEKLRNLKKVCFTRRTFANIPKIEKKIKEIEKFCQEHGKDFVCLTSPANYPKIDKDKRLQEWKSFFGKE